MSKLVSIYTWATNTYGPDAPSAKTLTRWRKAGRIQPAPVKHGRGYFVDPEARYTDASQEQLSLVERIRARQKEAHAAP